MVLLSLLNAPDVSCEETRMAALLGATEIAGVDIVGQV